ncbi:MAG: Ku protein [Chloroflexota bacterium]|nr:MAG: Ku protein [Chloroflexota bacterium]
MARAMWRGAIQFGLVTIPVKLYAATEARAGLSFNLLHKTCLNRVQLRTYCPFDDAYISRSDTVRGYEYAKGQYVVISDEDMDEVPLKTVRSIEIATFVAAGRDSEHGAQFVKSAYYLEPEAIGRKAFYLLKAVLAAESLSAVAKIVIKDREVLAAIDPYAKTMLLTTLHWPDEIRSTADLDLPEGEQEFKPAELAMARNLVAAMTTPFDAAEFHDEYREAVMQVIEAKIEGREVTQVEVAEEPTSRLVDLMAVLEASVAAAKQSKPVEAGASSASAVASEAASGAASKRPAKKAGAAKPASVTVAAKAAASKGTAARNAARSAASKATGARAAASRASAAEDEAEAVVPARRRKSA